jgi:hypothetical protein
MSKDKVKKLIGNFMVAGSIILIWRGIWYILDIIDDYFFGGGHIWSALAGIIAGVIILYIPDKDLKELGKL